MRGEQAFEAALQQAGPQLSTAGAAAQDKRGHFHHLSQRGKLPGPEQTWGLVPEGETCLWM